MSLNSIDYTLLDNIKQNTQDGFSVLVQGYVDNALLCLQTIEDSINKGDLLTIIGYAHSLKSASAMMGAIKVNQAAEKLENSGRQVEITGTECCESLFYDFKELVQAFYDTQACLNAQIEVTGHC